MSDSPEGGSQRDLADRIIDFLEYQKEVYGAFAEPPAPSLEAVQPTDSVILNNAGDITPQPSTQSAQNVEKKVSSGSLTQPQTAQPKENVPDNPQPSDIYDQVAACQTLDELYQVCLTADILRTDLENTNLVFGVGNPNADLLIIGEAPGQNEDIQKEPFVGRTEQDSGGHQFPALRYLYRQYSEAPSPQQPRSTACRAEALPPFSSEADRIDQSKGDSVPWPDFGTNPARYQAAYEEYAQQIRAFHG